MESIHIRQRLRPRRYAFLIKEGDLEAAMRAVSLNTAIWGGIYNPIVPLTPTDERLGLFKEFDPDELVNLTGDNLDPELEDRYRFRIISQDEMIASDYQSGKKYLQLGFNMLPILRHIFESEVKVLVGQSRAALISTEAAAGWPEYVGFAFGTFSYLPKFDIDMVENFKKALRAREVLFDPTSLPDNLGELITSIQLTRNGLQLFGRSHRLSSHIIYIGDYCSLTDLIEFWNIRATGCMVIFVPTAHFKPWEKLIKLVVELGHYPINPHLENRADLQKSPSISDDQFREICDWIVTVKVLH